MSIISTIFKRAINLMKEKLVPFPSNVDDLKTILNMESDNVEIKKHSQMHAAYLYYFEYLNNILKEDKKVFFEICNYVANYYSFYVVENEYTEIADRKTKYNLINNVQEPQNEVHRAISSLSEDAYRLGVVNFMNQTNYAKEVIRKRLPKEDVNKILGRYLQIKMISDYGFIITKKTVNYTLLKLVREVIKTDDDNKINFYTNLFKDIELFCGFLNGIDFKLGYSKANSINIVSIAAYSNIFTTTARQFMCGLYYRVGKSLLEFNGSSVVGVKEKFSPDKVWDLLRHMLLFRFYLEVLLHDHNSDERKHLQKPIEIGPDINSDADIDYYLNFFKNLSNELINSEKFKTTTFSTVLYNGKFTKVIVALLDGCGNDEYEKFYDSGIKCIREIDYDKDHIVPKQWLKKTSNEITTEVETKINSLGNIRLLKRVKNRSENKNILRTIDFGDVSFPKEMWGKEFTFDCISERQKWASDVIRQKVLFIYDYKF